MSRRVIFPCSLLPEVNSLATRNPHPVQSSIFLGTNIFRVQLGDLVDKMLFFPFPVSVPGYRRQA